MNNIPEGWKLAPVEPTDEMVTAAMNAAIHANSVYGETASFSDIWRAMLAAAPDVQGEPVGWQYYQDGKWWNGDDRIKDHRRNTEEAGFRVRDVYAAPQPAGAALPPEITREMLGMIIDEVFGGGIEDASVIEDIYRVIARSAAPQPAEQQPDDSAAARLDKQCREDIAAALGFIRGGNYAWSYLLQQIKDITSAEGKQSAPDVPELVEALEDALASLEEYAVMVDWEWGCCRDLVQLEADDELPQCVKDARAALAAHSEQGGEK